MLFSMVCKVWGFRLLAVAVGLALSAGCDNTAAGGESGEDGSTGEAPSSSTRDGTTTAASNPTGTPSTGTTSGATGSSSNPTTDPTTDPATTDPTASESGSDEGPVPGTGWLEIGYGLDEFFAFEEELPLTLGPQGFLMFSLPLRGSDFPIPPDPFDFDHPDTPVLSVWLDIDGIPGAHPSGHFAAYLEYPVPFTFSEDRDVDYEFVSVWLVIPETYTPAELAGREAVLHADLATSDGQVLVDVEV
ncbi:MAG: hypothetical protein KUG77_03470, partial [Nannocystaceae bacterium]|nr:hypothetical protein [Nannocystaceae bacterium]